MHIKERSVNLYLPGKETGTVETGGGKNPSHAPAAKRKLFANSELTFRGKGCHPYKRPNYGHLPRGALPNLEGKGEGPTFWTSQSSSECPSEKKKKTPRHDQRDSGSQS